MHPRLSIVAQEALMYNEDREGKWSSPPLTLFSGLIRVWAVVSGVSAALDGGVIEDQKGLAKLPEAIRAEPRRSRSLYQPESCSYPPFFAGGFVGKTILSSAR